MAVKKSAAAGFFTVCKRCRDLRSSEARVVGFFRALRRCSLAFKPLNNR
jgi:hypothetical protein